MDPIETYQNVDGHYVHIYPEPDAESLSPREDSNLGTIVAKHRRYRLSDERYQYGVDDILAYQLWESGDSKQALVEFEDKGDINDFLELVDEFDNGLILPLYMYEHSGVALSTAGFSCPWDSGQIGFIYATESDLRQAGVDVDKAAKILTSEVEEYSNYVNGEVYFFITTEGPDPDSTRIDSCTGFIGSLFNENGLYEHAGKPATEVV